MVAISNSVSDRSNIDEWLLDLNVEHIDKGIEKYMLPKPATTRRKSFVATRLQNADPISAIADIQPIVIPRAKVNLLQTVGLAKQRAEILGKIKKEVHTILNQFAALDTCPILPDGFFSKADFVGLKSKTPNATRHAEFGRFKEKPLLTRENLNHLKIISNPDRYHRDFSTDSESEESICLSPGHEFQQYGDSENVSMPNAGNSRKAQGDEEGSLTDDGDDKYAEVQKFKRKNVNTAIKLSGFISSGISQQKDKKHLASSRPPEPIYTKPKSKAVHSERPDIIKPDDLPAEDSLPIDVPCDERKHAGNKKVENLKNLDNQNQTRPLVAAHVINSAAVMALKHDSVGLGKDTTKPSESHPTVQVVNSDDATVGHSNEEANLMHPDMGRSLTAQPTGLKPTSRPKRTPVNLKEHMVNSYSQNLDIEVARELFEAANPSKMKSIVSTDFSADKQKSEMERSRAAPNFHRQTERASRAILKTSKNYEPELKTPKKSVHVSVDDETAPSRKNKSSRATRLFFEHVDVNLEDALADPDMKPEYQSIYQFT